MPSDNTQLKETSRGVTSSHHFHNVQCAIENILSLLEYSNDVVDRADQLSRRASNYITRHDLISSKISDRDISEDADRLRLRLLVITSSTVQNFETNAT
jgi:hypothetical protein